MQHSDLAFDLAKKFVVDLTAEGVQEGILRLEGRTLTVHFSPTKVIAPQKSKTDADDDASDVAEEESTLQDQDQDQDNNNNEE